MLSPFSPANGRYREHLPVHALLAKPQAEIEEIDEGTLMYYLHSHDAEYYKNYERKNVSKAEALSRAKVLMAKEKGLKDATIKKYFGNAEV